MQSLEEKLAALNKGLDVVIEQYERVLQLGHDPKTALVHLATAIRETPDDQVQAALLALAVQRLHDQGAGT